MDVLVYVMWDQFWRIVCVSDSPIGPILYFGMSSEAVSRLLGPNTWHESWDMAVRVISSSSQGAARIGYTHLGSQPLFTAVRRLKTPYVGVGLGPCLLAPSL